jgi:hypothetical protein
MCRCCTKSARKFNGVAKVQRKSQKSNESRKSPTKVAESGRKWQKFTKPHESCQKLPKVAESGPKWQKLYEVTRKVAESCTKLREKWQKVVRSYAKSGRKLYEVTRKVAESCTKSAKSCEKFKKSHAICEGCKVARKCTKSAKSGRICGKLQSRTKVHESGSKLQQVAASCRLRGRFPTQVHPVSMSKSATMKRQKCLVKYDCKQVIHVPSIWSARTGRSAIAHRIYFKRSINTEYF